MKFKVLVLILLCDVVYCSYHGPGGAPAGFMADCPGMNRSTTLSEETKASLSVVVQWPVPSIFTTNEKRCKLSVEGAAECAAPSLDLRRRTQVLISGYLDASFSPIVRSISSPYVKRGRNVILLEIFPVLFRSYPIAARLTKPLGKLLGDFLSELTRHGLMPNKLELVGGSLGAHIASYAAVRYRQLTGRQPARLTGLDPAGPCFRNLPWYERFHSDAALKVDALHTNIDGFGIADAVAQVDFYANGGEFQPSMVGGFILPCFLLCSHIRAAKFWLTAINNPDKFVAVRCNSIEDVRKGDCYDGAVESNVLGTKTNFSRPGIYYLPTRDNSPFYMGDEGLTKKSFGINHYLLKAAPDEDIIV